MATIVNNPPREIHEIHTSDSGGNGVLIALAIIILAAVLLLAFGRGLFKGNTTTTNSPSVNVTPRTDSGGTSGGTSGTGY